MSVSLLTKARREFHTLLLAGTLTTDSAGIPSNADRSNAQSKLYASHIALALMSETVQEKAAGQTLGGNFERAVTEFVAQVFPQLKSARPGDWQIVNPGNSRSAHHLANYEPYLHLGALGVAIVTNPELLTVLGNAYAICPDIIISRESIPDSILNRDSLIVDDATGLLSNLRQYSQDQPRILHAVISCKWTLRSDRAQNARSEALNLIRNRKGRTPHIVVVTGEPTPSRISSLALGTGDIDCVYHFALPELQAAVRAHGTDESQELLAMMVDGKRLKDIADLPLDLAV
jgi:NgoMIV restriction enzyme